MPDTTLDHCSPEVRFWLLGYRPAWPVPVPLRTNATSTLTRSSTTGTAEQPRSEEAAAPPSTPGNPQPRRVQPIRVLAPNSDAASLPSAVQLDHAADNAGPHSSVHAAMMASPMPAVEVAAARDGAGQADQVLTVNGLAALLHPDGSMWLSWACGSRYVRFMVQVSADPEFRQDHIAVELQCRARHLSGLRLPKSASPYLFRVRVCDSRKPLSHTPWSDCYTLDASRTSPARQALVPASPAAVESPRLVQVISNPAYHRQLHSEPQLHSPVLSRAASCAVPSRQMTPLGARMPADWWFNREPSSAGSAAQPATPLPAALQPQPSDPVQQPPSSTENAYTSDSIVPAAVLPVTVPTWGSDTPGVVFDNGTDSIRVGLATDPAPRCFQPCTLGSPRMLAMSTAMASKSLWIGQQAADRRGLLELRFPIARGQIVSLDDLQLIWNHMVNELGLRTNLSDTVVVMNDVFVPQSDPAHHSVKSTRHELVEALFDHYDIAALQLQFQAPLALLAQGTTTGCVVGVGEGTSHIMPVFDGCLLEVASSAYPWVGEDVSAALNQGLLVSDQTVLSARSEWLTLRRIREQAAYAALDMDTELEDDATGHFLLPDGSRITLGAERCMCIEPYFTDTQFYSPMLQPVTHRLQAMGRPVGLQHAIHGALTACDLDVVHALQKNVLLSGGMTLVPGFVDRLQHELSAQSPDSVVTTFSPEFARTAEWIGAAVTANHWAAGCQARFVTRNEWLEYGANIAHRKFCAW